MNLKYDWNDITIVPAEISDISSRSEVNPLHSNNKLPLFVSPMDTVINEENAKVFLDLGFEVCLPRGIDYKEELKDCFFSFGIDEVIEKLDNDFLPPKVLIDVANGHMKKLYDTAKRIKENTDIILMVGNIANPKTYKLYCDIGVDFIRVGIGGGSACTTSSNGGVHYPMASLVSECFEYSKEYENPTKIVADGGFKNFPDIIKAIASGSHYVMLGGILNKSIDSCSPCYLKSGETFEEINSELANELFSDGNDIYKYYRGMSTKEVQRDWGRKVLKTAEGVSFFNRVEHTMSGWTENFLDYLKSNMSYTGNRDLPSYIGNVEFIRISDNAFKRFDK